MAFFAPKKDNQNLRTLSEIDIQRKLYGRLKKEAAEAAAVVDPHASIPNPPEPPAQEPLNSGDPDLFHAAGEADKNPETGSSKATEKQESVAQWVRQENEVVSSYTREVQARQAKAVKPKKRIDYGKIFGRFVSGVGLALLNAVKFIAGGIIGIFFAVDFRKPLVRKVAYWLGAALLIAGLLYGIHLLNAQRENAIKGARQDVPAPAPQESVAEPEEPASSNPLDIASAVLRQSESVQVQEEPLGPEPEAIAPAAKNGYAIQVATYAGPRDAERVVLKLRSQNVDAFVKALTRPSGKVYHCVFVGSHESFGEAETALGEFKNTEAAKPFQDAFIRKL